MITFKAISVVLSMLQGNQGVLTMDEAVVIALQNSYNVKNAQETVNSNEQKVREARGGLGPKITTNYQYLRYGKAQVGDIGGQQITFVPLDSNTWSTQLTMPIDIIGVWKSNVRAAKAGVEASRNTKTASENDIKQNVRKSYLAVLRAKGLVDVAKQGVVNIDARVKQAQLQFNAGAIAKIDLTRLQAQKVSAEADVITAENGLQVAKQVLNLAINRPIETDYDVAPANTGPEVQTPKEKLIELGQGHRPEAVSFRNTVVALGAAKTYAGQGLAPGLNLTLQNQQALDPVGLNPVKVVNTAVLFLSVPLFDSGVARAKMAQTQATINQTINSLELLKLSISQEVRSALTNMVNARARQNSAIEQNKLAEEVVRIARIRRDAGEGTVLEIIDAETQWISAQNNLINSTYDYLQAYADLQRAVGADDIDEAANKFGAEKGGKN